MMNCKKNEIFLIQKKYSKNINEFRKRYSKYYFEYY